jgi:hypothetical protein
MEAYLIGGRPFMTVEAAAHALVHDGCSQPVTMLYAGAESFGEREMTDAEYLKLRKAVTHARVERTSSRIRAWRNRSDRGTVAWIEEGERLCDEARGVADIALGELEAA